jgi:hypothetical protein
MPGRTPLSSKNTRCHTCEASKHEALHCVNTGEGRGGL